MDAIVLNIVDDNLVEEGAAKAIAFGLLSFILSSSGIVNAAQFRRGALKFMQDKQVERGGKVTVTKGELKGLVEQAKVPTKMVGKWELQKARNIIARTLYMEAREDGERGLELVMTVVWNRAAGLQEQLVPECLRESQFSCWNGIPGSEKTPSGYRIQFPKCVESGSGKDFKMWNKCVELADQALDGKFKPADSSWNSYYNPRKCSPSWASKLLGAKMVGHHMVGELKDQTQHAKNLKKKKTMDQKAAGKKPTQVAQVKTKNYTVKPGDSLYAIAGKNMAKVEQIKKLNNLKSNVIRPGQKLNIPA